MKIKNISGEDRLVPGLDGRLVFAGQEVDVPAGDVESYICQESIWAKPSKSATNNSTEEVN